MRVAGPAREADALVDEPLADAEPARARLDEQQSQLGHLLRLPDEEHGADDLAVAFGDPAALARRIEVVEEVGDDARDERLELGVVAPLARVERAVAVDDPAHVARLVRAQQDGRRVARAARRAAARCRASPRRRSAAPGPVSGPSMSLISRRARVSSGANALRPAAVNRSTLRRRVVARGGAADQARALRSAAGCG